MDAPVSMVTTRQQYLRHQDYFHGLLRDGRVDFHVYVVPACLVWDKIIERLWYGDQVFEFQG